MQTDRTGSPFQHCFLFFSFSGNAGLFSLRLRIYANLPFFFIARANVRALETRKSERGAVAGKKNNEKRKKKHRDDCEGRGKLRHPRSLSATSFLIFVFLTSSLPLFAFLSGLTDASTLPTDRWKKKRKKKEAVSEQQTAESDYVQRPRYVCFVFYSTYVKDRRLFYCTRKNHHPSARTLQLEKHSSEKHRLSTPGSQRVKKTAFSLNSVFCIWLLSYTA